MRGLAVFRKSNGVLVPADEDAEKMMAKLKECAEVIVRVDAPRSLPQLRLYWKIVQFVAESTKYQHKDVLDVALRVSLGKFEPCKINGKVVPVVNSIALDKMPPEEFTEYFDDVLKLICSEVLPGMTSAELIEQAYALMGGKPSSEAA